MDTLSSKPRQLLPAEIREERVVFGDSPGPSYRRPCPGYVFIAHSEIKRHGRVWGGEGPECLGRCSATDRGCRKSRGLTARDGPLTAMKINPSPGRDSQKPRGYARRSELTRPKRLKNVFRKPPTADTTVFFKEGTFSACFSRRTNAFSCKTNWQQVERFN